MLKNVGLVSLIVLAQTALVHAQYGAPMPAPVANAAQPEAEVPIEVEAQSPGLGLHIVDGNTTATGYSGGYAVTVFGYHFRPLCSAPCSTRLAPGTYHLAVSNGVNMPAPLDHLTTIQGPARVRLNYEDRTLHRILGWSGVALAVAPILVGTFMLTGLMGENLEAPGAVLIGLGGAMFIVGYAFGFLQDHREVEVLDDRGAVRF